MHDPTASDRKPRRWPWLAYAVGAAVAWTAMITYFLVVPRWPDLRDSGIPSVALALGGVALAAAGLYRVLTRRRRVVLGIALAAIATLPAAFLAAYIFHLSYLLPSAEHAVAVGSEAPPFRLEDQSGRFRTLEELRGRWVVLDFFRGHW